MTKSSSKTASATLLWRDVTCRVKHTPKYFDDRDMVEIRVVKPKNAVLPITTTGYRCEFVSPKSLATVGGAIAYITALIDAEAKTKRWQKQDFERRQLRLFD